MTRGTDALWRRFNLKPIGALHVMFTLLGVVMKLAGRASRADAAT